MRLFIIFCLICFFVSCSSTKDNSSSTSSGELDGGWIPVKQELGGEELPQASFENSRLSIIKNTFLFIAESADEGTVTYSDGKMDIYVEAGVNVGKHFTAIYKLENNQLTICYNLAGDKYPDAFETNSNSNYFLSVFVKE